MTETFSHVALDGRLLPGVDARVDPGSGALSIRGPMLFRGYAGEPARAPGDWHRTGDLAILCDREIEILGRADRAIITGGENVSPERIERALGELDAVAEAYVFGLPDPRWGEVVAAAIVARDRRDPDLDLDRINARLGDRLAPFERPRRLWVIDDPPRLPSGKLDRRRLDDMLRSRR